VFLCQTIPSRKDIADSYVYFFSNHFAGKPISLNNSINSSSLQVAAAITTPSWSNPNVCEILAAQSKKVLVCLSQSGIFAEVKVEVDHFVRYCSDTSI
jgi:hypothetical protein